MSGLLLMKNFFIPVTKDIQEQVFRGHEFEKAASATFAASVHHQGTMFSAFPFALLYHPAPPAK